MAKLSFIGNQFLTWMDEYKRLFLVLTWQRTVSEPMRTHSVPEGCLGSFFLEAALSNSWLPPSPWEEGTFCLIEAESTIKGPRALSHTGI